MINFNSKIVNYAALALLAYLLYLKFANDDFVWPEYSKPKVQAENTVKSNEINQESNGKNTKSAG